MIQPTKAAWPSTVRRVPCPKCKMKHVVGARQRGKIACGCGATVRIGR